MSVSLFGYVPGKVYVERVPVLYYPAEGDTPRIARWVTLADPDHYRSCPGCDVLFRTRLPTMHCSRRCAETNVEALREARWRDSMVRTPTLPLVCDYKETVA